MTLRHDKVQMGAFALLGLITIGSVLAAFTTQQMYLALIPLALLTAVVGIINFKLLYYILLVTIPLSMEYNFTPSLGTDLPDEPLMVGLMLVTFLYIIKNPEALPRGFLAHVLLVFLIVHLFWIFMSSVTSVRMLVSFKVFFSKIWYVTTFTLLTVIVIKTKDDLKRAFWCIYIPLTLLIVQVLVRYSILGFAFDEVNKPMWPFFRNHVNYAAIITVFLPFIWLVRSWYPKGSNLYRLLNFSLVFYVVAIYLSYTRTCYLALLAIVPFYWMVKYKLTRVAVAIVLAAALGIGSYLFSSNNYLKFAPDFEETVYHDAFDKHLSSTFQGKDVSSMERVYRWVAILHMFQHKPMMGFGPGNFYPYYKQYTVTSFSTYVSENEERSTAHNYPLLLLAEQGIVGVLIFLAFSIAIFIYGEKIYHNLRDNTDKQIVMTLLVVLAMVYVNLMLSDLIESDKVGPFFFMSVGLIAAIDIRNRLLHTQG